MARSKFTEHPSSRSHVVRFDMSPPARLLKFPLEGFANWQEGQACPTSKSIPRPYRTKDRGRVYLRRHHQLICNAK
jgi:hypothetical protein